MNKSKSLPHAFHINMSNRWTILTFPTIHLPFEGGSGMVWCILWMLFTADTPEMDATIPNDERGYIITSIRANEIVDSKLDGLRCSHVCVMYNDISVLFLLL